MAENDQLARLEDEEEEINEGLCNDLAFWL